MESLFQQGIKNEAIDHVTSRCEGFLNSIGESKLQPLFNYYRNAFIDAPAATKHHHNFTHGLILHTDEVWSVAAELMESSIYSEQIHSLPDDLKFSKQELFNAVFLHDFAKIVQYEPSGNFTWRHVPMVCNQETWTLRELARFGIELTDNELVGLLHAEGGYTEFQVEWRPMSVIVHSADLWSSQVMKKNWDPAAAMDIKCPKCGAAIQQRSGPRGEFYGCTKYPECRGLVDGSEVGSVDEKFLQFIKSNYPL